MDLWNRRAVIIVWLLLAGAAAAFAGGMEAGTGQDGTASLPPTKPDPVLLDLIRVTQALAQKSQAELENARLQNEALQRALEQTRQELARLREEVSQLRSSITDARPGASSAAPAEKIPGRGSAEPVQSARATNSPADVDASLAHLKDQVEMNSAQVKELEQTKVESDSRFKVRLFGTLLSNTYFNTADSSDEAVPAEAPSGTEAGEHLGHNLGATLRQTNFGFAITGPKIGTARLSATADFDFFGGSDEAYDNSVLGSLRMRTATARLDGPRTSLVLGLMSPMISPLNPTSLAAVSYPALGESGNLWQWLPQVAVERRAPVGEGNDFVLQAGLMMPFGERAHDSELQGKPGYESRIAYARRIDQERHLEIGVGGYVHPFSFGFGRSVDSFATTGDWLIPLAGRLELSGEAYYGRGINLIEDSGGNLASVFAFTGPLDEASTAIRGIYSIGGWTQLKARATQRLEFNAAFGLDDPRNRDVFAGLFDEPARLKNQTLSVNSILRLRSNFLVSLEYRRLWTTSTEARSTNDHFNLAIGYLF